MSTRTERWLQHRISRRLSNFLCPPLQLFLPDTVEYGDKLKTWRRFKASAASASPHPSASNATLSQLLLLLCPHRPHIPPAIPTDAIRVTVRLSAQRNLEKFRGEIYYADDWTPITGFRYTLNFLNMIFYGEASIRPFSAVLGVALCAWDLRSVRSLVTSAWNGVLQSRRAELPLQGHEAGRDAVPVLWAHRRDTRLAAAAAAAAHHPVAQLPKRLKLAVFRGIL